MIADDSVIPIKAGFYTASKINAKQMVWGANGLTFLERVEYNKGTGVLVETKHHSIITCPHQKFFSDTGFLSTSELNLEDYLLTSTGEYERILNIIHLENIFDMFRLVTQDSTFSANGFILIS